MALTDKKCVPCEGGVQPFTAAQIKDYLAQLNPSTSSGQGWEVEEGKKIKRKFKFKDFKEAMEFLNKVADIAERENPHQDMKVFGWNKVEIELSTHAICGLSENDFILAAKIEQLE